MSFMKKNFGKLFLLVVIIFLPLISLADGETCEPGKICNPLATNGINTIQDFIRIALQGAVRIGLPVVALAIIYCGFLFVSAQGNPGEIEKAKSALLYTLIGAALLIGAWAIAIFISETVRTLSLISSIC